MYRTVLDNEAGVYRRPLFCGSVPTCNESTSCSAPLLFYSLAHCIPLRLRGVDDLGLLGSLDPPF